MAQAQLVLGRADPPLLWWVALFLSSIFHVFKFELFIKQIRPDQRVLD